MPPANRTTARPFLKWAGGKTQLLPELLARIPSDFNTYHEPFVGGGALFFALAERGRLRGAMLSDANGPLIDTWLAVRDHVEAVIDLLRGHRNDREHFYSVRAIDPSVLSLPERAARMIYLNRTCFNGLWRENSRGQFNVPFGGYANPRICDAGNLRAVASVLAGVDISCRHFRTVLDRAGPRDFVYFDPPYQPVSETASFTSYDRAGFGEREQTLLRDVFAELAGRRVNVMLSNSDTPAVRGLYLMFRVDTVFAARAINSRGDRRGKVAEVIVRNHG